MATIYNMPRLMRARAGRWGETVARVSLTDAPDAYFEGDYESYVVAQIRSDSYACVGRFRRSHAGKRKAITTADFSYALKTLYPQSRIEALNYYPPPRRG